METQPLKKPFHFSTIYISSIQRSIEESINAGDYQNAVRQLDGLQQTSDAHETLERAGVLLEGYREIARLSSDELEIYRIMGSPHEVEARGVELRKLADRFLHIETRKNR